MASTNLPDTQQMTREGKVPRGAVRVIWGSTLIPNDPIVIGKDLPDSLKQAIQQSLTGMKMRNPEAFPVDGAWIGGFVKVDDAAYQIIRALNETAKRMPAPCCALMQKQELLDLRLWRIPLRINCSSLSVTSLRSLSAVVISSSPIHQNLIRAGRPRPSKRGSLAQRRFYWLSAASIGDT